MLHSTYRKGAASSAAAAVSYVVAIVFACFAFAGAAWASVEANSADTSQLETIKGIGPSLSGKILAARKQGAFKDWSDLATRVSGVGEKNSAAFSRAGLTVGGRPKEGAPASGDPAATKSSAGGTGKSASKKASPDVAATTLASSTKK